MDKGEIEVLQIKFPTDYVPIGCLTSNGISESVDMRPTTTRASGGWKTERPTGQSFNIVFEGLQKLNDSTIITYDDIRDMKRLRTRIEWGIFRSGTLIEEGYGYITELGKTAAVGEFISFSGNIEGYGVPVVVEVSGDLFQDGNVMLYQDGNAMIFQ